jgi:Na+-transporting NADH:ubiquinone oxidoreductase subunit NqrE
MDKSNTKMAGVYGVLLLAWWSGWLALDAWRIEHLLTNVDKWVSFRQDILICVVTSTLSAIAMMVHAKKINAVYALLGCLAATLAIMLAHVGGTSFINWQFNTALFWTWFSGVGFGLTILLPVVTFFAAKFLDY